MFICVCASEFLQKHFLLCINIWKKIGHAQNDDDDDEQVLQIAGADFLSLCRNLRVFFAFSLNLLTFGIHLLLT